MEENNDVEKLVIAQALYKSIGAQVDTKSSTNLRARVDNYYKNLQMRTGARTFDLKMNDVLVGTYTRRKVKEKREKHEQHLNVDNEVQLKKWLAGVTNEELREYALDTLHDFARYKYEHDGEIPYGCTVETIIIPGEPEKYTGVLKVDPQLVGQALSSQLPESIRGLLESAGEDGYDES